jgi:hypothetical protein
MLSPFGTRTTTTLTKRVPLFWAAATDRDAHLDLHTYGTRFHPRYILHQHPEYIRMLLVTS